MWPQAAGEGGEGEDKADHCAEQAICKGGAEGGAELTDTTSENSSAQKAKHQKTGCKGGHKNQQRKKGSKGKGGGKGDVDGKGKGKSEDKGDGKGQVDGKGDVDGKGKGKSEDKGDGKGQVDGKGDVDGKGKGKSEGKGEGKGGTTGADIVQGLAGGMGSKLALALLLGLGLTFSDKANALYGLSDMYGLLLSVCCREGNESSVSAQYERSKRIRGAPNLPSRQWAYDIIREVRYDFMLKRCRDMITRSMVKARRHGMLRRPVDVSIDYHDIPFYAKVMRKIFAVFSEYKRGTDQFNRLATLHCVVDGERLTLGVEVFRKESDTNAIVVRRLLYRCRRRGILMSSVTVDRGFHAVDVLEIIKNMGIPVVMPAVKLKRVKEAIIQYDAGEREAVAPHSMTSASGQTTSYTLVIIRRREERSCTHDRGDQKTGRAARQGCADQRSLLCICHHHARLVDWRRPAPRGGFLQKALGHRELIQAVRTDEAPNHQHKLLRPHPAVDTSVRVVQHLDTGPLYGGAPRGRRLHRSAGHPEAVSFNAPGCGDRDSV